MKSRMKTVAVGFERRAAKYTHPRDSMGIARIYLDKAEEFLMVHKESQIPPAFILFSENEALTLDGRFLMESGDDKDVFAFLAKKMAKEVGAIASVFTSEIWFAKATPEEQERMRNGGEHMKPSQNPDRVEGVMVVGEYKGTKPAMAGSSIVRDTNGLVMTFKPFLMPAGMEFEGRFAGII